MDGRRRRRRHSSRKSPRSSSERIVPSALALHDNALDLIEAAIRTGSAVLDDIAADLAGSAALTGL